MATQKDPLFSAVTSRNPNPRMFPANDGVHSKKFAIDSGAPLLAQVSPVSQRASDGRWAAWSAAENAAYTITANAAPATAGTFTLTFNGETTAAIAFDATAAVVQAAVEALGSVNIGDVTGVATTGVDLGDASAVVTLTFGGSLKGVDVSGAANFAGLTGNTHVLAETVVGAEADLAEIAGFIYVSEGAQLSATEETIHQVLTMGVLDARDVPLLTGESQGNLDTALKSMELRRRNITVKGIEGSPS